MLLIIAAVSIRAVTGTVQDYSRVRAQDIARYLSTGATLTNEETEALVDDNEYISVRDTTGRISAQSVDLAQSMSLLSDDDRDEAWVEALALREGVSHRPGRELYVYAAPYSINGQPAGVVEVWKSIDETRDTGRSIFNTETTFGFRFECLRSCEKDVRRRLASRDTRRIDNRVELVRYA